SLRWPRPVATRSPQDRKQLSNRQDGCPNASRPDQHKLAQACAGNPLLRTTQRAFIITTSILLWSRHVRFDFESDSRHHEARRARPRSFAVRTQQHPSERLPIGCEWALSQHFVGSTCLALWKYQRDGENI